jgi:hypothetical protein
VSRFHHHSRSWLTRSVASEVQASSRRAMRGPQKAQEPAIPTPPAVVVAVIRSVISIVAASILVINAAKSVPVPLGLLAANCAIAATFVAVTVIASVVHEPLGLLASVGKRLSQSETSPGRVDWRQRLETARPQATGTYRLERASGGNSVCNRSSIQSHPLTSPTSTPYGNAALHIAVLHVAVQPYRCTSPCTMRPKVASRTLYRTRENRDHVLLIP